MARANFSLTFKGRALLLCWFFIILQIHLMTSSCYSLIYAVFFVLHSMAGSDVISLNSFLSLRFTKAIISFIVCLGCYELNLEIVFSVSARMCYY